MMSERRCSNKYNKFEVKVHLNPFVVIGILVKSIKLILSIWNESLLFSVI